MIIVIFAYKLSRGGNDGKLLKISTILAKREREREGGRKRPKRGPSEKEKWGGEKAADSDGEEEEEEEKEGGVEPSRQKLQV